MPNPMPPMSQQFSKLAAFVRTASKVETEATRSKDWHGLTIWTTEDGVTRRFRLGIKVENGVRSLHVEREL